MRRAATAMGVLGFGERIGLTVASLLACALEFRARDPRRQSNRAPPGRDRPAVMTT